VGKKASSGFNTPFERLQRLAKTAPPVPTRPSPTTRATPPTPTPTRPTPPRTVAKAAAKMLERTAATPTAAQIEEDRSFEQAMRGATPLAAADRGKRASPLGQPPAAPRATPARREPQRNDDADADAELAELVSGGGGDGGNANADRRLVRNLRQGAYPIEADLDLHGHSRDEGEQKLERFIAQAQSQGRRCVRVIHGRGLNSGDEGPVLRDAVQRALAGGRLARAILAFTFAAPAQGGDGATLILLRKKKA
jgi:DNA-nicking Smr family endonuclease